MKMVKVHDETFRVCRTRELESLEMPDSSPVSHFRDTNSALWNGVAATGTNIGCLITASRGFFFFQFLNDHLLYWCIPLAELWVKAATWEADEMNFEAARALMQ